jgi:hypothetical protein
MEVLFSKSLIVSSSVLTTYLAPRFLAFLKKLNTKELLNSHSVLPEKE